MGGEKKVSTRALARLAGLRAMAVAARHMREWSAEIRSLALAGTRLPFAVLFFWCLGWQVRVFANSRCCAAYVAASIPNAGMHLQLGEKVSGTLRLRDPAPGVGK